MSFAPLAFALLSLFPFAPSLDYSSNDASQPVGGDQIVRLDESRTVVERASDADAMLDALNAERASHGLVRLSLDERLCEIARSHAEDMAQRSYFGHTTPEGLSPFARMARANYRFAYAGENLALDQSVAAASHALWLSIEHRSNILQPHFARVGIAAVSATDGEIFVEDFSD